MGEKLFVGIDIGGTKTSVVLGDERVNILKKAKFRTTTPKDTLDKIIRFTEKVICRETEAIGISCGGPLDSKEGLILSPPNLKGWDYVPIVRMLEQRFGISVYLKNDADACAIAEWKFGAGRGARNVVFLTFGTGMGAGMILNGSLYSGACDMAGEIGHVRLYEKGHEGYGKEGAFEGYCSGAGIVQYGLGNAKEVAKKASEGDFEAIEVFKKVGCDLGKGISILIDVLNPEVIIIGSIYVRTRGFIEESMMREVRREALHRNLEAVRIVPSQLGEILGDVAALSVAIHGCKSVDIS